MRRPCRRKIIENKEELDIIESGRIPSTTILDVKIEQGRELDLFNDPEHVRLIGLNLELAIKNLRSSRRPPEKLVLTADICTHRIVAFTDDDGEVRIVIYEN